MATALQNAMPILARPASFAHAPLSPPLASVPPRGWVPVAFPQRRNPAAQYTEPLVTSSSCASTIGKSTTGISEPSSAGTGVLVNSHDHHSLPCHVCEPPSSGSEPPNRHASHTADNSVDSSSPSCPPRQDTSPSVPQQHQWCASSYFSRFLPRTTIPTSYTPLFDLHSPSLALAAHWMDSSNGLHSSDQATPHGSDDFLSLVSGPARRVYNALASIVEEGMSRRSMEELTIAVMLCDSEDAAELCVQLPSTAKHSKIRSLVLCVVEPRDVTGGKILSEFVMILNGQGAQDSESVKKCEAAGDGASAPDEPSDLICFFTCISRHLIRELDWG